MFPVRGQVRGPILAPGRRVPRPGRVFSWSLCRFDAGQVGAGSALAARQALIRSLVQGQSARRWSHRLRWPRVRRAGRWNNLYLSSFGAASRSSPAGNTRWREQGSRVAGQAPARGPGHVEGPAARGPPVQAEVLGLLDVVLHVDVRAVAGVQPRDLPAAGAGGDEPVAAAEFLLPLGGALAVAGVQRLVADDDPQAGDLLLPGAQVKQAGQVRHERVLGGFAVLADPAGPGGPGPLLDGGHFLIRA